MEVNPIPGRPPLLEDDDWCSDCAHLEYCPLIQALASGVAVLNENIIVNGCQLHVERIRKFGIIDGGMDPATNPANHGGPDSDTGS